MERADAAPVVQLTPDEWRVLCALARDPRRAWRLRELGVTPQTAPGLVALLVRLARRGLVAMTLRGAARRPIYQLTDAGLQALVRATLPGGWYASQAAGAAAGGARRSAARGVIDPTANAGGLRV